MKVDDIEARLEALETRVAFQEDLLASLNDHIAKQAKALDIATQQLVHLNQKLKQVENLPGSGNDDEPPPPHY